jgi:hypothetical protein
MSGFRESLHEGSGENLPHRTWIPACTGMTGKKDGPAIKLSIATIRPDCFTVIAASSSRHL